jgi:hypothetical protein
MLSSQEKTFILTGTLVASVVLLSTSLDSLNSIILRKTHSNEEQNIINKLIVVNGVTMLFSAATFSYFAFNAIK